MAGVQNKKWRGNNRGQIRDLQTITQQIYDRNFKRIAHDLEPLFTTDQMIAINAANIAAQAQLEAQNP